MRVLLTCFMLAFACTPLPQATSSPAGPPPEPPAGPPAAAPVEPPAHAPGRVPPPGPYAPGFDVQHYAIELTLPDTGAQIRGRATLEIAVAAPHPDTLRLDLTGLAVTRASVAYDGGNAGDVAFRQHDGRVLVPLARGARTLHVALEYQGVPDDGLIIRPNLHGERGAFADNWPDRARFWFPSIDHPSDKATVNFIVHAPAGWSVIANGTHVGVESGTWRWRMSQPIPTYLMVIGATRFARADIGCVEAGRSACVPTDWWSFPQDSAAAALAFRRAGEMLAYYARLIAPYPYERLSHVQSSTSFGGMENATAIFYSERAVATGRLGEGTVAHEIAHQWFGNAVTPARWSDLWLSEGFATYFGMLFFEADDGPERFRERVRASWRGYLRSEVTGIPVVDTLGVPGDDLLSLLNANSYNKGGAVLHMLRGILGDSAFFAGLRQYYREHTHGNATTRDVQRALEAASGRPLGWFFEQWLYRPGHPILQVASGYEAAAGEMVVRIAQVQPATWPTFRGPLEVELTLPGGRVRRRVELAGRETVMRVKATAAATAVTLDPDGWLLHEVR